MENINQPMPELVEQLFNTYSNSKSQYRNLLCFDYDGLAEVLTSYCHRYYFQICSVELDGKHFFTLHAAYNCAITNHEGTEAAERVAFGTHAYAEHSRMLYVAFDTLRDALDAYQSFLPHVLSEARP